MKKSSTCYGKSTGKPLTEYGSFAEAVEGVKYSATRYSNRLIPYQCRTCSHWHLSPQASRSTTVPRDYCDCVRSDGSPRAAYRTESDASRRAQCLREATSAALKVYPCTNSTLWHLTRQTFSSRKSTTCMGKHGEPLTVYRTFKDADLGALFVMEKYGKNLKPLQCRICNMWHLAKPKSEIGRLRCRSILEADDD